MTTQDAGSIDASGNLLGQEKSPYLLQHRSNPIAWKPWGEFAFARAKAENKPIFLSVGYSTCHWCHVMAHESFEDKEVARVLNSHFVSVKVDREERPDVDHIYMQALQALTGGGGWPMSVWLTPEGKPFFAGTYFPKPRFLQLLGRIHELWNQESDKLIGDSERLTQAIAQRDGADEYGLNVTDGLSGGGPSDADIENLLNGYEGRLADHFDDIHGGFGGAPKFPQAMTLMMLMRVDLAGRGRNRGHVESMVVKTLLNMIRGGIFDQLEGGFHRYSVDDHWLVPHFEKMLYDQAMLTVALVEAYQLYGVTELARAARETMDYVLREMVHPMGGFYSAQDADSVDPSTGHSEEGHFCTYLHDELRESLSAEELAMLSQVFGVSQHGQFEGRNILHLQDGFDGASKSNSLLVSAFAKLRKIRQARPAPHLDDKIIVSWNAWTVWALVKAGLALDEPRYLDAARKTMGFIKKHLFIGDPPVVAEAPPGADVAAKVDDADDAVDAASTRTLARYWRDGEARGRAQAEDYVSLIHACIEIYQVDFDKDWAEWALELQLVLDKHFWNADDGLYAANDGGDPYLPLRPKDDYDGVSPCSNSMAVLNLERLYILTGEAKYKHFADHVILSLFPKLRQFPSGLSFLAQALDFRQSDPRLLVLSEGGIGAAESGASAEPGSGAEPGASAVEEPWVYCFQRRARRKFLPYIMWSKAESGWPTSKGKTSKDAAIHVCHAGFCEKILVSEDSAAAADLF